MCKTIFLLTVAAVCLFDRAQAAAAVPSLEHPLNGSTQYQTLPYFEWNDAVPAPYSGKYQIQIATDSNFVSLVDNDIIPATISWYATTNELTRGETYHWRVRHIHENGTSDSWTPSRTFTLGFPKYFDVGEPSTNPSTNWKHIQAVFAEATAYGTRNTLGQWGCIRFPANKTYNVREPNSGINRRNVFLNAADKRNWILEGNGSAIIIELAEAVADNTGYAGGIFVFRIGDHAQVSGLTIDFNKNSLNQVGGVITKVDKNNLTFSVRVDSRVFTGGGWGREKGVFMRPNKQGFYGGYQTTERWEDAYVGTTKGFHYYDFKLNPDKCQFGAKTIDLLGVEPGYYWVTDDDDDHIFQFNAASNVLLHNITILHTPDVAVATPRGEYLRVIGVNVLRPEDRFFSGHSSCNSRSRKQWFENCRFEYVRDDLMNFGADERDATKRTNGQQVIRNMQLVGGLRNAILDTLQRSWISGNTIVDVQLDLDLVHLNKDTIIEDNLLVRSRSLRTRNAAGGFHENLIIRNNILRDCPLGISVKDARNSRIYGNRIEIVSDYLLNAPPSFTYDHAGFEFDKGCVNISGTGNVVSNIIPDIIVIDPSCRNIDIEVKASETTVPRRE